MPTLRRQTAAYIRFLKLSDSITDLTSLPLLCSLEQRIIRIVALAWYEETRLSVNDMQGMSELGSHETVRRYLISMRKNGWVAFADTPDARRKQVVPTAEASVVLDMLGACLSKAMEGPETAPQ
jgi:hypothetical protein